MANWSQYGPQLIAAIIGSSLIVTALTSLASFINRPFVNIIVDEQYEPEFVDKITYRIEFVNIGNSPAKNVRLTMTYPDATSLNSTIILKNENASIKNETPTSVVAFLPRLSPGVKFVMATSVGGIVNSTGYYLTSSIPYSIAATYDEGGTTYVPNPLEFGIITNVYFNLEILKFLIPLPLAFLCFGIALRYKKKSQSKFASKILKDILTVETDLKNDESKTIFSAYRWDTEMQYRAIDNYEDDKLVDNFYEGLKERDSKFSTLDFSKSSEDENTELKQYNRKTYILARSAHANINWKKFFKLDLVLLLPAVGLGSFFVTYVSEGVPTFLFYGQDPFSPYVGVYVLLWFVTSFLARATAGFFMMRLALQTTQGTSITNYILSSRSRLRQLYGFSAVILGLPSVLLLGIIFVPLADLGIKLNFSPLINSEDVTSMAIMIDISRMFLFTWVVSKWIKKIKLDSKSVFQKSVDSKVT